MRVSVPGTLLGHLCPAAEGLGQLPFGPFKGVPWGGFPGGPGLKTPCSRARGAGLIPGQGTRSPRAAQLSQINTK